MHENCIIFELSSITYAQKSKLILKQHGIKSNIYKAVDGIDGCGYKLKVSDKENNARRILTDCGVPIRGSSSC